MSGYEDAKLANSILEISSQLINVVSIDLCDILHLEYKLAVPIVGEDLIKKVDASIVVEDEVADVSAGLCSALRLCEVQMRI